MKEEEVVGEYFGRVMAPVSQMRAYGETIADRVVVEKVLQSLNPKFDYVVPSIEINNDLAALTPVKLMGCLQSKEERMNRRTLEKQQIKGDEQALQVMQDFSKSSKGSSFKGRGRLSFRGRGRGRNRDRSNIPQCSHCNKYGHEKKDCWWNDEPAANVATRKEENQEDDERLFMALTNADSVCNTSYMWFLDSGASNHMIGSKECFAQLDESFKIGVKLGDKKELAVQGKGTVKIDAPNGNTKLLDDVYYAPQLGYNLLSVGQLLRKGYSLLYDNGQCVTKNKITY
ncbi:uncharacterized protein LOC143593450 [Bidens hawaiensis]|uniref:uncharacterized protein LOC143593450 n=1 Tax=Bidens hawaiensis TaxID=980011 RepID=UPI00404AB32B